MLPLCFEGSRSRWVSPRSLQRSCSALVRGAALAALVGTIACSSDDDGDEGTVALADSGVVAALTSGDIGIPTTVTVVDGLPRNAAFLAALASELKKALGTGGSALESSVEIQGDRREAIRARLAAKGWTVKG